MFAGYLALVIAAAFSGAAFYVNFAEQHARLTLDDRALLAQWQPSYKRGYIMQGTLAIASAFFGLLAAILTHRWPWVIGALLIAANWPYTILIIRPTNAQLMATPLAEADEATRGLIRQWGRLHAVRTALGIASLFAYMSALAP
jgi:hypothetical protein